ncbi:hypothetical protein BaRGS_00006430 [Batillaria attramentaria]|uniref:Uncharacterized protein n=1 Tax=Batillaria attramentaria TaxID=370345 RepID=A0ABD0LT67_9CAEN
MLSALYAACRLMIVDKVPFPPPSTIYTIMGFFPVSFFFAACFVQEDMGDFKLNTAEIQLNLRTSGSFNTTRARSHAPVTTKPLDHETKTRDVPTTNNSNCCVLLKAKF